MKHDAYIIRRVRGDDLPALAAIEQLRWSREGTAVLPLEKLDEWYQTQSPFFLVAEKEGVIAGFYYGMQVSFSLSRIEEFTSADSRTDQGYTVHAHEPQGKSVYGVNVVTITPEAGAKLNAEVHRLVEKIEAEYFIGFTRLVHLDHYLRSIALDPEGSLPYHEEEIALWYAHQTMKMVNAPRWDECTPQPQLDLSPPRRPDTILKFHVSGTNLGLLRVVPNYMVDPKSRNYGAFIASRKPHFIRDA